MGGEVVCVCLGGSLPTLRDLMSTFATRTAESQPSNAIESSLISRILSFFVKKICKMPDSIGS